MLSYFQHGDIEPGVSQRDIKLCEIVEQTLRGLDQRKDAPGNAREFIADLLAQPRGCRRSLRVARDADQALYSAKNSGRDRVTQ